MICLKPLRIVNPKYKIEGRNPKEFISFPDYFIFVPCGQCYSCFKTWQSSWRVRLLNHWKYLSPQERHRSVFVTFTFSDKYIKKANKDTASFVKHFRDAFRKKYKRSCTFWMVREYGEDTNRLHYHGILFDFPGNRFDLSSLWPFGHTNIKSVTTKRVSYITKYATKGMKGKIFYDKSEKPKIYCSPGIGKAYCDDPHNKRMLKPFPGKYNLTTIGLGMPYQLPKYYKDKMLDKKDLLLLRIDSFMNPFVKPPYRIGNLEFNNLSNFINRLYTDYRVLSPLINQLYEQSKQN